MGTHTSEQEARRRGYNEALNSVSFIVAKLAEAARRTHNESMQRVCIDLNDDLERLEKPWPTLEPGDRVRIHGGVEYILVERGEGKPDSRGEHLPEGWWRMRDDEGKVIAKGALPERDLFLVRKRGEQ